MAPTDKAPAEYINVAHDGGISGGFVCLVTEGLVDFSTGCCTPFSSSPESVDDGEVITYCNSPVPRGGGRDALKMLLRLSSALEAGMLLSSLLLL